MRTTSLRLRFLFLTLLVPLTAPPATATTMLPLGVEQLAAASDAVVRGTTLDTRVAWDEHRRIVTTARIEVVESLRGTLRPGDVIEVITLGGSIDGILMTAPGAARFDAGDDVVVFLDRAGPSWSVADLAQGKFEVTRDASGREVLTRRDLEGVQWIAGTSPAAVPSLAALRQRVARARGFRLD